MGLSVDSTRAFVSLGQKRELIEAVRDAPRAESEPDWLEWKSTVELSEKRWQVEIARFVLGAANRLPNRAAQAADGQAYLLLGVEPQNLCGVSHVDNADLENCVCAYTGSDGPHWSPEYVEVNGADVLVVTIAAPKLGDPIFALAKDFDRYRNGEIFVRRLGKTERASRAELRLLQERLVQGGSQSKLDIEVGLDNPTALLSTVDLSETSVDEWIRTEQLLLARPQPKPAARKPNPLDPLGASAGAGFLPGMQRLLENTAGLGATRRPEDRKPEDYDAAVSRYLDGARAGIRGLASEKAVASQLYTLRLVLQNRTSDNYEEVVVELYLPGDVRAYYSVYETEPEVQAVPARPRKWGPRTVRPYDLGGLLRPSRQFVPFKSPTIRNDGSATVIYPAVHLRPEAERRLDPVFLVAAASTTELVGRWQATSTGVSGVVRGDLVIPLGDPVSLCELFNRPNCADDPA